MSHAGTTVGYHISEVSRHRWSAITWLVGLALIAYHIDIPVRVALLQRGIFLGVSLAFVVSLPFVVFAPAGCPLLMRTRAGALSIVAYILFIGWVLLGAIVAPPDRPRVLVQPIGSLLMIWGVAWVFYRYWPSILSKLPTIILTVVASFFVWFLYVWMTGQYVKTTFEPAVDLYRFQVGAILPTQLAAILVTQLCFLLFLLRTRRGGRPLVLGLVVAHILLIVLVAGSAAGSVGMAIVLCIYIFSGSYGRRVRLVLLAGLIIILSSGFLARYVEGIKRRAHRLIDPHEQRTNIRWQIYLTELAHANENPLFGIGQGNFRARHRFGLEGDDELYNTHQNLLGRACENGIPAAVLYAVFILLTTCALWVRRGPPQEPATIAHARLFLEACLCIFIFLQFRGLFHETWSLKELLFIVGAGLGVRTWLEAQRRRLSIVSRRPRRKHVRFQAFPAQ